MLSSDGVKGRAAEKEFGHGGEVGSLPWLRFGGILRILPRSSDTGVFLGAVVLDALEG